MSDTTKTEEKHEKKAEEKQEKKAEDKKAPPAPSHGHSHAPPQHPACSNGHAHCLHVHDFKSTHHHPACVHLSPVMRYQMCLCALKYDHFERIHQLPADRVTFVGAPNFRQVAGLPVFGTGQPTLASFRQVLSYVRDLGYTSMVWTNMRQEPVVYVNGESFTPREQGRLNENMEFSGVNGADLGQLTAQFVAAIEARAPSLDNKVRYYRDTFAEHPDDRVNKEHLVPLESIFPLDGVYDMLAREGFNVRINRLPIVDEKAPEAEDFDALVSALKDEDAKTACFFNCQMGKGRTTTGMICACLLKETIHGLTAGDGVEVKIDSKMQYVSARASPELRRGEFAVIRALLELNSDAKAAKAQLDRLIDLTGPPFALQNLREAIIWTRDKRDEEPTHKKPYWERMGKNFVERYYVLICFAVYAREQSRSRFSTPFARWLTERPQYRETLARHLPTFAWE